MQAPGAPEVGTAAAQPAAARKRKRPPAKPARAGSGDSDASFEPPHPALKLYKGLRHRTDGSGYQLPWDVRLRMARALGGPRVPIDICRTATPEEGAVAADLGAAWWQLHPEAAVDGGDPPADDALNVPPARYREHPDLWARLEACEDLPALRSLLTELRDEGRLLALAGQLLGGPVPGAQRQGGEKQQAAAQEQQQQPRKRQKQQQAAGKPQQRARDKQQQQAVEAAAGELAVAVVQAGGTKWAVRLSVGQQAEDFPPLEEPLAHCVADMLRLKLALVQGAPPLAEVPLWHPSADYAHLIEELEADSLDGVLDKLAALVVDAAAAGEAQGGGEAVAAQQQAARQQQEGEQQQGEQQQQQQQKRRRGRPPKLRVQKQPARTSSRGEQASRQAEQRRGSSLRRKAAPAEGHLNEDVLAATLEGSPAGPPALSVQHPAEQQQDAVSVAALAAELLGAASAGGSQAEAAGLTAELANSYRKTLEAPGSHEAREYELACLRLWLDGGELEGLASLLRAAVERQAGADAPGRK